MEVVRTLVYSGRSVRYAHSLRTSLPSVPETRSDWTTKERGSEAGRGIWQGRNEHHQKVSHSTFLRPVTSKSFQSSSVRYSSWTWETNGPSVERMWRVEGWERSWHSESKEHGCHRVSLGSRFKRPVQVPFISFISSKIINLRPRDHNSYEGMERRMWKERNLMTGSSNFMITTFIHILLSISPSYSHLQDSSLSLRFIHRFVIPDFWDHGRELEWRIL